MVSSRVALGSVSTLAVGALLLGAAPLVLRTWMPSNPTPWGSLASFSGNLSSSTPTDGDRSQLLRLAALKSGKTDGAGDPAMSAAAQLAAVPAPVEASSTPAPPAAPVSTPAADAMASGSTTVEEAPVALASPDGSAAEAVPLPPTAPPRVPTGLININRATPDVLDHFPGAGRIGRAIVSHRPYHAIADLVRKRVLRTSDFARIQGRISVD